MCPAKKRRRENWQDARFCTHCGAAFTPFKRRGFIIALGLTAIPFIITLILLALDSEGDMYFEELVYILAITLLMENYLALFLGSCAYPE